MVANKLKKGRNITEIKFMNDHPTANMLALTKYLGLSLAEAKELVRIKPGVVTPINPGIYIRSELPLDDIITALDEYEINVSITISA